MNNILFVIYIIFLTVFVLNSGILTYNCKISLCCGDDYNFSQFQSFIKWCNTSKCLNNIVVDNAEFAIEFDYTFTDEFNKYSSATKGKIKESLEGRRNPAEFVRFGYSTYGKFGPKLLKLDIAPTIINTELNYSQSNDN